METCSAERSFGYIVADPGAKSQPKLAAIEDGRNESSPYSIIDVTNDTNSDIIVRYYTESGDQGHFIVPKSVKTKGRALAKSTIKKNSVWVSSTSETPATGNVIINVGN